MRVLYTAFKGKTNSSKILLDKINSDNKIYLTNSFTTSVKELIDRIKSNEYDVIVAFGQAPIESDTIKIETTARAEECLVTDYDFENIKNNIEKEYKVVISNNAGNYLCNNIYYNGLKYIKENGLKTKMIFIHIPKINNINNIEELSKLILLDEKSIIEYQIILNLRKREGINLLDFYYKFNKKLIDLYNYNDLINSGLLVLDDNFLFIPEDKWYISNEIIVRLLGSEVNE